MRLCDVAKRNGYDLKPIFQPATAFPFFRQARTRSLFSTVVVRCQTRWALEFGTTPYVSGTAVSDTVACRAPLAAHLKDMQRALLPCFRASSPSSLATKNHLVRKRRKPCVPLVPLVPLVPSLGSQRLPFLPCFISATLPLLAAGGRLRGSGARPSSRVPRLRIAAPGSATSWLKAYLWNAKRWLSGAILEDRNREQLTLLPSLSWTRVAF